MNPTRRQSFGVPIAILVAVVSLASSASALGSPLIARSSQGGAAEADITRTNLAGRMEAALGDAFGGVWFEPSTAQLHVGITSSASRQAAEAVAARASLAEIVTETPVTSTWAQLQAAQDRWDERLMALLERGEAATAVDPESNAVEVELGSLVPRSRRNALARQAEADSVDVSIKGVPYPHLRVVPQARCNKHAEDKAFCDPTLVAGMTFASELVTEVPGEERHICTTGPTVVKRNFVEPTKIYVLTAGHCISDANEAKGGNTTWHAYNTGGEIKEVGPAKAFLKGETDVGVVEVTTGYWATAKGFFPVAPTIAPWDQEEPEPFSVTAERVPVKNTNSCISGQTIGTNCGEIVTLDQTIEVGGVVTKNLVEVKAKSGPGDSGSPWYAETQFKKELTGYVEGTHVGKKGATNNPVFEPLWISFEELKKLKVGALDLELLTTANENREHIENALTSPGGTLIPAGTVVEAESTNTTLDGSVNVACKKSTVKAEITSKGGTTGPVKTLTFSECEKDTVSVSKGGSLSITGSGTVTSNEAEVTVQLHRTVLGFPVTTHCIYKTNNTKVGTLTDSNITGSTATMDIGSAIPQVATDGACGSTAEWTGSYKVTSPDFLDLD